MLTYLRVKNVALVSELSLEPGPGCNIITGETGAGKSVLMGALGLALGFRGDKSLIRTGTDQAVVEAVFSLGKAEPVIGKYLESVGVEPCEEGLLRVKRSLGAGGTNRQFVNGTPVSVSVLGTLGDWLVDIHGPHEHQSLLYPTRQLEILDSFGKGSGSTRLSPVTGYAQILQDYAKHFGRLQELDSKRKELIVDEQTYRQQLDMLRYQVKEIESANLDVEEDSTLEERYTRAAHAVDILRCVQTGIGILSEDENAVVTQCGTLGRLIQEAARMDPAGMQEAVEQLEHLHEQLNDLQSTLVRYQDSVEVDTEQLQRLEERLNLLSGLKRKYGYSIEEILHFGVEARERLEQLENRDAELEELNAAIQKERAGIQAAGNALTKERAKLIPSLEKVITGYLNELGFNQGYFKIELSPLPDAKNAPRSNGLDQVEFLFAPNPGEPAKPLRTIASSGEIARVMLALKTALAQADHVPVLVFDEIDANVGGETGLAVGRMMREIGTQRQVFCITHLAPVAASGNHHFCVEKYVEDDRTCVKVTLLKPEERVTELARMLGGQMDEARMYAKTLLSKCNRESKNGKEKSNV